MARRIIFENFGADTEENRKRREEITLFEQGVRNRIEQTKSAVQMNIARVANIFESRDLQRIFQQLDTSTAPKDGAILRKQQNILEIRERGLLDEELLKQALAVYAGSGLDFEYPLLLGARQVIMVDPMFGDERNRAALIERISRIAKVTESTEGLQFEIEFVPGNKELVTLTLRPEMFGASNLPHNVARAEQLRHFSPGKPLSLLLGFRTEGADIDSDPDVLDKILPGGAVLADHASGNYLKSLTKEEKYQFIYMSDHFDVADLHASLQKYWAEQGFDFVPLKSEGDSYHYTFLKKRDTSL